MSEPKINYLGPACEAAIKTLQSLGYAYNGGQQWKPPIGTKPDFDLIDTLRAERDALQLRLNAADQRIDELTTKPSDVERQRLIEIIEQYPNGDPLEYDAAVRKLQQ